MKSCSRSSLGAAAWRPPGGASEPYRDRCSRQSFLVRNLALGAPVEAGQGSASEGPRGRRSSQARLPAQGLRTGPRQPAGVLTLVRDQVGEQAVADLQREAQVGGYGGRAAPAAWHDVLSGIAGTRGGAPGSCGPGPRQGQVYAGVPAFRGRRAEAVIGSQPAGDRWRGRAALRARSAPRRARRSRRRLFRLWPGP